MQRGAGFRSSISLEDPRVRESIGKMGTGNDEAKSDVDAVTSLHILAVK